MSAVLRIHVDNVEHLAGHLGAQLHGAAAGSLDHPELVVLADVIPDVQPGTVLRAGVDDVEHFTGQFVFDFINTLSDFDKKPGLAVAFRIFPQLNGRAAVRAKSCNFQYTAVFRRNGVIAVGNDFFHGINPSYMPDYTISY